MRTVSELLDIPKSVMCTVDASATVCQAVTRMSELGLVALLVLDEDADVIGIFTEHDLLVRVIAEELDPHSISVAQVMTDRLVTIVPDASLDEALALMREHDYDQILVADGGEVFGFVLRKEITRTMVNERDARITDLTYYITHG